MGGGGSVGIEAGPAAGRLAVAAALLSAGILGYEIALMRVLLVASWHHFAFVVVSIALLGFGASGAALSLARPRLLRHGAAALLVLTAATAVSMPLCALVAQHIPFQSRIVPALWARQVFGWIAYWAVLFVPFFLGASAVGFMLMLARHRVASVYAGNMVGSGIGALGVTFLMSWLPPAWLGPSMALPVLAAAIVAPGSRITPRIGALAVALGAALLGTASAPPHIRPDPFKYSAYVQRLERQGSAERVAATYGPRGVVEVYQSEHFHDMPFLSVGASPPLLDALVIDGHWSGSLLRVGRPEEARAVDHTLMASAYPLLPSRPRVLLLGETGGQNVWLAVRNDAASVHVVQPNGDLLDLLTGPLRDRGGLVMDRPEVHPVIAHPRHFVQHTGERFDLIQLVAMEQLTAGSGGVGGLAENHLITVEGLSACLEKLSPHGLISVCRGIQSPPRDNLKLLATFVEALRRRGVDAPDRYIVILRDFLAVCMLVREAPWAESEIRRIRRLCEERELTPVWFPGVRPEELNRPDALPTPPGGVGDWYHHAAASLFSSDAQGFIDGWVFDIRPPTDDRPFFADFSRTGSVGTLKEAFGDQWLARVELGFLFVLATLVLVTVGGAVLTLLPLVVWARRGPGSGRGATVAFFGAIGVAYLMLEITWLSRLTHLVGDPVLAAAVTIASFLIFSGLGGFTAERCASGAGKLVIRAVGAILLIALMEGVGFRAIAHWGGEWPTVGRCLASSALVAPLAYAMGFLMPLALRRVDRAAETLVPWAWGINGFASVLAAPLATAIGMTWGFSVAGASALVLYIVAASVFPRLPGREGGSGEALTPSRAG